MAINSLSDLTHEEFMHQYNTYRAPLSEKSIATDNAIGVHANSLIQKEIEENKSNEETRVYSYFVKKIINSTHEEILTKYTADVIKPSSKRNFSTIPSSIDWRQKVNL